ncbi:YCF48-related protein [Paenibacillus sp. VCA1]|uniref:WD40/YVTN/BNR-like repeat-containing protein n=1 Tax=Paenibacillus sp. VCA1 TaxID=3039148 RepID=UPI002872506D|nr:YCF48-related protein [Paenibacillus sp. VCA1]MDR9855246.1 YCF48-related protein [Paenibacillus sp. VCA1]
MKKTKRSMRAAFVLLIFALMLPGCAFGGSGQTAASGDNPSALQSAATATGNVAITSGTQGVPVEASPKSVMKKGAPVKIEPGSSLYEIPAMDFVNADTGFAVNQVYAKSLSLISTTDGGAQWEATKMPGELVLGLDFIDRQTGWVLVQDGCSAKGTTVCKTIRLIRTKDGGKTWTALWQAASQEDNSHGFLNTRRLSFDSPKNGVMLANGRLFVTRDGGVHFDQVSFGVKHFIPLYVNFPSERIGYVVGTVGGDAGKLAVLKTTDGARTWRKQLELTGENSPLSSLGIDFKDERIGWLLTNEEGMLSGELYRTTDGGEHWAKMSAQRTGRPTPTDIRLADADTGVMSLHPGAGPIEGGIWITHDGGKSFASVAPNHAVAVNQVQMLSPKDIWAAADGVNESGFLLHSADGGKTWKQTYPAVRPIGDVSMIDSSLGYAVGTLPDNNVVLQTVDGGASWNILGRVDGYLRLENVSFINKKEGYVVAFREHEPHHVLLKTSDEGKSWTPVEGPSLQDLSGVSDISFFRFYDQKQGVLVASSQEKNVWRTSDGGETWKQAKPLEGNGSGTKAFFIAPKEGWMAQMGDREHGPVLFRLNEQSVRKTLTLPKSWFPEAIAFADPRHGYIVFGETNASGSMTHLLATADGGKVWTDHPIPKSSGVSDASGLYFADAKHGWLRFYGGTAATGDGGLSWSVLQ